MYHYYLKFQHNSIQTNFQNVSHTSNITYTYKSKQKWIWEEVIHEEIII